MNSHPSPKLKESWVQHAIIMLEQGNSQISIITFLRSQGINDDLAKELSYDVFATARKKVLRKQRPHRIIAWSFIALGVILPIVLFLAGWIVIYALAPIFIGITLLFRLPNPKGLPRESNLTNATKPDSPPSSGPRIR